MTQINDLFFSDSEGLVPYLGAKFGEDFNGFQIKAWNFGDNLFAEDQNFGIRTFNKRTTAATGDQNSIMVKLIARVGRVLIAPQQAGLVETAGVFSDILDYWIVEWGRCHSRTLKNEIQELDGLTSKILQNGAVRSGAEGAWAIAVFREFDVWYEINPLDILRPDLTSP